MPKNAQQDERIEKLAHQQFLNSDPVVKLDGTQFPKSETPIAERVEKWLKDNRHLEIAVQGIGTVVLNKRAVHNSLGHGYSRNKVVAFAALPEVLKRGRIIYREPMRQSPKWAVYHVAAPIFIGSKVFVASVLVKSDSSSNRMYVHEVVLKTKLQESANKHSDTATRAGDRSTTDAGAMHKVLRDIFAVKADEENTMRTHVLNWDSESPPPCQCPHPVNPAC